MAGQFLSLSVAVLLAAGVPTAMAQGAATGGAGGGEKKDRSVRVSFRA